MSSMQLIRNQCRIKLTGDKRVDLEAIRERDSLEAAKLKRALALLKAEESLRKPGRTDASITQGSSDGKAVAARTGDGLTSIHKALTQRSWCRPTKRRPAR